MISLPNGRRERCVLDGNGKTCDLYSKVRAMLEPSVRSFSINEPRKPTIPDDETPLAKWGDLNRKMCVVKIEEVEEEPTKEVPAIEEVPREDRDDVDADRAWGEDITLNQQQLLMILNMLTPETLEGFCTMYPKYAATFTQAVNIRFKTSIPLPNCDHHGPRHPPKPPTGHVLGK